MRMRGRVRVNVVEKCEEKGTTKEVDCLENCIAETERSGYSFV